MSFFLNLQFRVAQLENLQSVEPLILHSSKIGNYYGKTRSTVN